MIPFCEIFGVLCSNMFICLHEVHIWRNCYHLANLHSGHVGRTPGAIAYIVYIGKNKLKPNSSLVHVETQEARITIYSVCPHWSIRPKFSFIDTKFGVPSTDKFLKRSSLFITMKWMSKSAKNAEYCVFYFKKHRIFNLNQQSPHLREPTLAYLNGISKEIHLTFYQKSSI